MAVLLSNTSLANTAVAHKAIEDKKSQSTVDSAVIVSTILFFPFGLMMAIDDDHNSKKTIANDSSKPLKNKQIEK